MADNAAIEAAMAAAKARIEHSELPPGHSMSPGMQGVQGGLDKEEEADPDDLFNRLEKHITKGIETGLKVAVEKFFKPEMLHKKKDCSTERIIKWFRDMCAGSGYLLPVSLLHCSRCLLIT